MNRLKNENKTLKNIIAVFIGALLMGMLWLVHGDKGWSGFWGLLNVGYVYTTYIICLLGGRKKLGLGWLMVTAVSFMLTVPASETLIRQICGTIVFDFNGETCRGAFVSLPSAIILLFCMGFGTATFFGMLLGRSYSTRAWRLWHFVAVIVTFYAVLYIFKASAAHGILKLIQPQAGELFQKGLSEAGHSGGAWINYLKHLDNESWSKTIYGGWNYFTSIKAISMAFASIASLAVTQFIVKDRECAKTSLMVCLAFAFSVVISDWFLFVGEGGWHGLQGLFLPATFFPKKLWNYSTGFIAGGIITAVMLSKKAGDDVEDVFASYIPSTLKDIFGFIFGYIVLVLVNVIRPVVERFDKSMYQIIYVAISVVFAIALIIFVSKKCGINVDKVNMRYYSAIMLIVAVVHNFVTYMFIGMREYTVFANKGAVHYIIATLSFLFVIAWAIQNFIKIKKLGREFYRYRE